jgi:peroxiredoxin
MCHLQELYAKYKDQGLVVIGLDPADDKKIALEMLQENGVTFPNIIDDSDNARHVSARDYPMGAWPTSYLIDREGKIADAWCGYEEGHARVKAALEKSNIK